MEAVDHLIQVDRDEYERLKRMEANLFPATQPQELDTGKYGKILVVQTWVMHEKMIHKLSDGSYCHSSGLPVSKASDLEIIENPKERAEAREWFEHRNDEDTRDRARGITIRPDNTLVFEDGEPVRTIADITQAIKPGQHQELLIRIFLSQEEQKPSEVPDWMEKKAEPPKKAAPKKKKPPPKKKSARPPKPLPEPKPEPMEAQV